MKKNQPIPQTIPTLHGPFPFKEEDIKKYLTRLKLKETPRIIFFGSDSFVVQVLQALEDNFEVVAVVTASGSAVANYFKGPILTPDRLDENFLTSHLSLLTSDLFTVASYGKIIPKSILDIPKFGALNVHPSLLPKYRGSSPVPRTILNGDKITGVTIIRMDEQMDHGPIVATMEVSLTGQEDMPTLINKLFQLGAELIVEIIPDYIEGKLKLKPQNHSQATYCLLLTRESGYFEIASPPNPEKLDRMIRAYYPWPGVWTKWNNKIVKFYPSSVIPAKAGIHTNEKFLIQMEGKKIGDFKNFLNSYPDFPLKP